MWGHGSGALNGTPLVDQMLCPVAQLRVCCSGFQDEGPRSAANPMLHNWAAVLFRQMGAAGAVRTRFCTVHLSGPPAESESPRFWGLYVLMEKIERGPERVCITKLGKRDLTAPSISGGYLFKRDTAPVGTVFTTPYGQHLEIIEPDEPQPRQTEWLQAWINQAETALPRTKMPWSPQQTARHWDWETFRDHIILSEVFKNPDAYQRSVYFTKDREGPVRALPLWDFDMAMGSTRSTQAGSPHSWIFKNLEPVQYPWFVQFIQNADCESLLRLRYRELRTGILATHSLHGRIDRILAPLIESAPINVNVPSEPEATTPPLARHFQRWPASLQTQADTPTSEEAIRLHSEKIEELKRWLTSRLEWMDQHFDW